MTTLEEKLGYTFQNPALLENALTHSSCANESRGKLQSNERLEFLGDSILGMVVADHLYRNHPDLPEGELTRTRAALVCEESLVEVAAELNLGEYLRLGKGEESGGGRHRPSIQADAVEAVLAAVYGNRAYDNALAELCAVLEADGFHTVAGAAFACRHAFTDALADGRPDWDDKRQMESFAARIADKVAGLTDIPAPVAVPGDPAAPYYVPKGTDGQPVQFLKAKPQTDLSRCTDCGACARLCPMGAINPSNVAEVPGTCIKCQCCVRKCTKHAKYFDDPAFLSHVAMLEQNFTEPKENEVFL